jgi:lipoprotein-anchoring transpeptidase ErfK/SrfK
MHRARRRSSRRPLLRVLSGVLLVSAGAALIVLGLQPRESVAADPAPAGASTLEQAVLTDLPTPEPTPEPVAVETTATLPDDSGDGRRIVFDQGDQRVWLVGADGDVERSYLVSGSRYDNLRPGTYAVQSRTRDATAFDGSGTMEYFVRFATGFSEPIGFHSVPVDNTGALEQTEDQLGTPLSAGCVRQWKPDAIALWDFAPVGTTVVVTR